MTAVTLTLLGLSVGTLIAISVRSAPPRALTLRERAITAQQLAAQAARLARELAEQAAKEAP